MLHLCRAVLLEPLLQAPHAVLRRVLIVSRTVVGIKPMTGFRIDDNFRLAAGGLYRRAHLFDGVLRNPGVLATVQTEHRRLQLSRDIDRMCGMKLIGSTD